MALISSLSHAGHFVFTMELLPLLQRTTSLADSNVRTVTASSAVHSTVKHVTFSSKEAFQSSQRKPEDDSLEVAGSAASDRWAYTKFLKVLFAA